jgi:hypothetical protein
MGQAYCQAAQREQMQCIDQGQGINMQSWAEPRLRTMICWWGTGAAEFPSVGIMSCSPSRGNEPRL